MFYKVFFTSQMKAESGKLLRQQETAGPLQYYGNISKW